jgi:site-specific recombinase XerC
MMILVYGTAVRLSAVMVMPENWIRFALSSWASRKPGRNNKKRKVRISVAGFNILWKYLEDNSLK